MTMCYVYVLISEDLFSNAINIQSDPFKWVH